MLRNTDSKSRVTKLCHYADNEIKMVIDNTNKPVQTTLKYKRFNTKSSQGFWWLVNSPLFLSKWWAFPCIWYNLAFK